MCHPHVAEDEPRPDAAWAHHLGDGVRGLPEGREDTDRNAAETRHVFWAEAGPDAAAVLVVVSVEEVMDAFDAPVAAG